MNITLAVKNLAGSTLMIDVSRDDTVGMAKDRVAELDGIAAQGQTLCAEIKGNLQPLEDEKTLGSYGITQGMTLFARRQGHAKMAGEFRNLTVLSDPASAAR
mmetsp:Transcript_43954/g.80320  ORF Transcript_43954/g.80320 Transcript_43954/m.80320 type:complete len:102 (-) Transcript_43954:54-359(-)